MSASRRTAHDQPGPTDGTIDELVAEAERGYDLDALIARRGRRGRPPLGSAAATVESVRLDPDLKRRLNERAERDGVPVSEVIRTALREHLGTR